MQNLKQMWINLADKSLKDENAMLLAKLAERDKTIETMSQTLAEKKEETIDGTQTVLAERDTAIAEVAKLKETIAAKEAEMLTAAELLCGANNKCTILEHSYEAKISALTAQLTEANKKAEHEIIATLASAGVTAVPTAALSGATPTDADLFQQFLAMPLGKARQDFYKQNSVAIDKAAKVVRGL